MNCKTYEDGGAVKGLLRLKESEETAGGTMKQATIPAFIPNIIREHRYKYMPHCSGCGDQFTETGFLALERTGYNIVWDIELARCPICGGQVEAWRHPVQSWRRR